MLRLSLSRRRSTRTKLSKSMNLRLESLENRIALTSGVTNLGLEGDNVYALDENVLAFAVDESRQGGTDLNGDEDTFDKVVHVFDAETKTTKNLGLHSFDEWELGGNLLAISVHEFDSSFQGGVDLNGDGDTNDGVMHVFDTSQDISENNPRNLQLDSQPSPTDGTLLVMHVSEGRQGRIDLNGDGDPGDSVVHIYDPSQGVSENNPRNLGFATVIIGEGSQQNGNLVAFAVSESGQGGNDLNGDGDTVDSVLHLYDANGGTTTNLGLVPSEFRLEGNLLAFAVSESAQGGNDLNGDGDAIDSVLHVYNTSDGTTTNLGLAGASPWGSLNIQLDGNTLAFLVSEFAQGAVDLNGDGNTFGSIVHVYDANTGATENLNIHVGGREGLQLDGNLLAFTSGGVMHVYDASQEMSENNPRSLEFPTGHMVRLEGILLYFGVRESSALGTDLNGDGDFGDDVLHVFDADQDTITNLRLTFNRVHRRQLDGNLIAIAVDESSQGNTDLNGDGDTLDDVMHVFDARTGVIANFGLENQQRGYPLDGNVLAFSVSESSQGGTDLNGDGDTSDFVVHVVDLAVALPATRIGQLIAAVEALNLQNGIENSLDGKLDAAQSALSDINENNNVAAINSMQAFINAVESQIGGKIDYDDGVDLIADAQLIIDFLEDPLVPVI